MANAASSASQDTSIRAYRAKRDFGASPEPSARPAQRAAKAAPIFVVQKHAARRLHWDFRLEHGGVLWSWAVPKGPSLDPHDKRLAVRTEDHPLDYANFSGTIPAGHYGAGTVEIWDRGTWSPREGDAAAALRGGEMKFVLEGGRLKGGFVLVRLKPRPKERAENWLLIKEHDADEQAGADEARPKPALPPARSKRAAATAGKSAPASAAIPGARKAAMPSAIAPELATLAETAPPDEGWLCEVKFDGYRLLAFVEDGEPRLMTRNAHDWTHRLRPIADAVRRIGTRNAVLDGELVALRDDGVSSFALLQQALSTGDARRLHYYLFDLLYLDGNDLRGARLIDRKQALASLIPPRGIVRYSDHAEGFAAEMRSRACGMGLEGVICKRADSPYRSTRGRDWIKLKCSGREEFVVLGWTPPAGSRVGLGALHVGYRDEAGAWQYAGGVGTGFDDAELQALRERLDALAAAAPPPGMMYADERPESGIRWVAPDLVVEVQLASWTGAGRVRHAVYLGLREDKPAGDVVRALADPEAKRVPYVRRAGTRIVHAPAPRKAAASKARPASKPVRGPAASAMVGDARITHADRELWPGVTKRDLAEYWLALAEVALPELAGRPLALVRCPEGVAGEHFFQKHARPGFPASIRGDEADGAPYLVLDDTAGLLACAQVSAIEVHAWGARLPAPTRPDRLVFDLDPGEGVDFGAVMDATRDVRERLRARGLESFCRTTGGKGLHVVVPLAPRADWDTARAWCRSFAERMAADSPDRYVSRLPKKERLGKILVDWLRNGLGSTAVASFSPRARPGATVAVPIGWNELRRGLDPAKFTIVTVPARARRPHPWGERTRVEQVLPKGER